MASCAKCGRQDLPKRKSDGARVCKRCGVALSSTRHFDRSGKSMTMEASDDIMKSRDFQISNAVWSLETEFERFLKLARDHHADALHDIHWLRLKFKEWDQQLSVLDDTVEA